MEPKHTFEEWLNGEIVLKFADTLYNPETTKPPFIVDYSDFSNEDIDKIRHHQHSLFRQRVENLLVVFENEFKSGLQKSYVPELFYARTIELVNEILFGTSVDIELTNFEFRNLTFQNTHLKIIRNYATQFFMSGKEYQYENIQIDNSPYFDHSEIQLEVYTQALWEHLISLNTNKGKRGCQTETNWFKIGLLFANGKMDELLQKNNQIARRVSEAIGLSKSRPYISDSCANTKTGAKNIFANKNQIEFITKYCEENNIPIVPNFHRRVKGENQYEILKDSL